MKKQQDIYVLARLDGLSEAVARKMAGYGKVPETARDLLKMGQVDIKERLARGHSEDIHDLISCFQTELEECQQELLGHKRRRDARSLLREIRHLNIEQLQVMDLNKSQMCAALRLKGISRADASEQAGFVRNCPSSTADKLWEWMDVHIRARVEFQRLQAEERASLLEDPCLPVSFPDLLDDESLAKKISKTESDLKRLRAVVRLAWEVRDADPSWLHVQPRGKKEGL